MANTTKVIAGSVFRLRERDRTRGRVGRLIFDVNGGYANENTQDGTTEDAACLKNVGAHTVNATAADVSTYGLAPHPYDADRKIVTINLYGLNPARDDDAKAMEAALEPLFVGKRLVDEVLSEDGAEYIRNFRSTAIEIPAVYDGSASVRLRRSVLIYRAVLNAAGLEAPGSMATAGLKGLFGKELIAALNGSASADATMYAHAAIVFGKERAGWDEVVEACRALRRFIADANASGYAVFNAAYAASRDGRSWADDRLTGLLGIFEYPNGPRALKPVAAQHDPDSVGDYAESIVDDLLGGKLVIFDQSLGDPDMNKAAAERIKWSLFNRAAMILKGGKGKRLTYRRTDKLAA